MRREFGPMRFEAADLGRAAGSRSVGLRRYRLAPGDRPTPPHVHGAEEEIFYVLSGSGLSWQDGATFEIRAGDCIVHLPAWEVHTIVAGSDGLDVLAFGQRIPVEVGYLLRAHAAWLWPTWVETASSVPWEYDWSQAPEPWQREVAAGDLDLPPPGDRPGNIVNVGDVEPLERHRKTVHSDARDLARAAGSERTGLKHVTTAPGMLMVPPHCHSAEEELFVVLEGEGTLELTPSPDRIRKGVEPETHPVRPGTVVSRRAGTGVAHTFRAGDGPLEILAYGTRDPSDVAYYPRSNKLFIRGAGIVIRAEHLDYWTDEE
jgi:uncharacterized cupin superfamily protein